MVTFEFHVAIPADRSFAVMIRNVVAHGARQAGSADDAAVAFGRDVEDAVREMLGAAGVHEQLTLVLRKQDGPMEVVINDGRATRTLALDA